MHDIFISYCHDDNEKLLFVNVGWVDVFFDTLKKRIAVNSPRNNRPEIWLDRNRVEGNSILSAEIETGLREAKLLVPVISPSYVSSDWCKVELQTFCELRGSHHAMAAEGKSRVFKVIKNEVGGDIGSVLSSIPGLDECIGFDFYDGESEINPLLAPAQAQPFSDRVNKLAKEILKTLGSLRPADGGATIFLGNCSRDMAEQADILRKELEMFNNVVVRVPPDDSASPAVYRDRLRSALAKCRIAIAPVGAAYGAVPEGYDSSPFVMQYEEARAEAQRRPAAFTQLIWMLPDGPVPQESQQRFIDGLEVLGPQFHKLALEDFKTRVRDVLAATPSATAPENVAAPVQAAAVRKPSIYLICDQKDDEGRIRALTDLLKEYGIVERSLLEREIRALAGARASDLEAQLRKDHQDNLTDADAVLVYHGEGDQLWLRAKLRELRNAPGYGRTRPFSASAVILADPIRDDKETYDNSDLRIINGFGAITAAALEPFFSDLARSSELAG